MIKSPLGIRSCLQAMMTQQCESNVLFTYLALFILDLYYLLGGNVVVVVVVVVDLK